MALKIRLRQQGRNNRPFYRLVVTDVRAPRDGKYLEALGWYNPFVPATDDKHFSANADRLQHWIAQGAEVSENVQALLKRTVPSIPKQVTEREVAKRAKALEKKKVRAKKAAK